MFKKSNEYSPLWRITSPFIPLFEAAGDLVLMQTSLFLSCKSCCFDANKPAFEKEKQRSLYQNTVTGSLASNNKPGNSATTVKRSIDCRQTKPKVITPTNQNRRKQYIEPIRIKAKRGKTRAGKSRLVLVSLRIG